MSIANGWELTVQFPAGQIIYDLTYDSAIDDYVIFFVWKFNKLE